MRRGAAVVFAAAVLLTGCWDAKTIQDINYVAAVGFDYQDGKYIVYTQLLDFTSVAKQEGGATGRQQASVWVGKSEGGSVHEAITRLYSSAQQPMFWGHVSSFVFSEAALKHGVGAEWIDAIIRFREMRYTQWVFGTKESIEQVLTTRPFFNLSPMSSILHEPEENYKQLSFLYPIQLNRFMADLREPGRVILLPSLGIDRKSWTKDNKRDAKLYLDGVFGIVHQDHTVWLDRRRLKGLRWLDDHTVRTPLSLSVNRNASVQLMTVHPKSSVAIRFGGEAPIADVEIDVSAAIGEMNAAAGIDAICRAGEQVIVNEVRQTFEYADNLGIDVYSLEYRLYHDHFRRWHNLTRNGQQPISPVRLGRVNVNLALQNSGMYTIKTKRGF